MAGFNLTAYFGVDASGVKSGVAQAESSVKQGAAKMEAAGAKSGRGFQRGAQVVSLSSRKAKMAVLNFSSDLASGADLGTAFANSLTNVSRGLKGMLAVTAAVGIGTLLASKFREAGEEAKKFDEILKKARKDGLNAKNANVEELIEQYKTLHAVKKQAAEPTFADKARDFLTFGHFGEHQRQQGQEADEGSKKTFADIIQSERDKQHITSLRNRGQKRSADIAQEQFRRSQERKNLELKLRDAGASEAETTAALGVFDQGTRGELRARGLRRIGQKGKARDNTKHSELDYFKFKPPGAPSAPVFGDEKPAAVAPDVEAAIGDIAGAGIRGFKALTAPGAGTAIFNEMLIKLEELVKNTTALGLFMK